jgi:poly-gamma-glutamate synthesis protein (capsule biosynthesis protein)
VRARWYSVVFLIAVLLLALVVVIGTTETLGDAERPEISAEVLPTPTAQPSTTPVPDPTADPTPESTPTPTPEPTPDPPIVLAFGGDVHFEGILREALLSDPEGILDPFTDIMSAADLAVVNLETAVTERGVPEPKDFTFRAPPLALDALIGAGIDVVSLANNHGVDYGQTGLADTLDAIAERGLGLIGAGRNRTEAIAPYSVEIRGVRIAILAATQVLDGFATGTWVATDDRAGLVSALGIERQRFVDAVAAASEDHDVVIAFMHWGIEKEFCPAGAQISIANDLVAAGADAVIGTHAHRIQANGMLADTIVHYGMGNLVFYSLEGPGTESGIFELTIDPETMAITHEWIPATLVRGVSTPYEPERSQAEELAAVADQRRDCAYLEP